MRKLDNQLVVYTVILGDGYRLPKARPAPGVDYICFTDQDGLEPNEWELSFVDPLIPTDLPRSSRQPKIEAHKFLKSFTRSLYIDPSVELSADPESLWAYLLPNKNMVFGAMYHSYRDTLEAEFEAVSARKLESRHILAEQFNAYLNDCPDVLYKRPIWGGMLARRHNEDACVRAMERWFALILRYSRRDQLSLPFIVSRMRPELVNLVKCDIRKSVYHSWPTDGYKRPARYYKGVELGGSALSSLPKSLRPPNARVTASLDRLSEYSEKMLRRMSSILSFRGSDSRSPLHQLSAGSGKSVHFGLEDSIGLFYAEDRQPEKRVYVAHQKRLELYRKGVDFRIRWLLRDYRIQEDTIHAGDLVVDIGANNGELGLWALGQGARYIGFEPDPMAFKALSENVGSNLIFDVAVSDSDGSAKFYLATDEADSSLYRSGNSSGFIEVSKRALDSILEEIGVDGKIKLLKIEAEGMEPEVIAGALNTLERVELIAVDAGPERGGENTAPEVLNALFGAGFSLVSCFLVRGTFLLKNTRYPH